jgi:hypothetical protein
MGSTHAIPPPPSDSLVEFAHANEGGGVPGEGEVLECSHAGDGDEIERTGAMSSLATGAEEEDGNGEKLFSTQGNEIP